MDTQMMTERRPSLGQADAEAMLKAGQAWVSGLHDMSQALVAATQAHVDQTLAAWKDLAATKSLPDAMKMQTHHGRSMVAQAIANANAMANLSMTVAKQTAAPIAERMTLAAESLQQAAATPTGYRG